MADPVLDFDIDVIEQPETPHFPRRPNIVSRRGHSVRFTVSINDVPENTKFVTISASVFAYGTEHLGPALNVSRKRKLWGRTQGTAFEIDSEELPAMLEILVSEDGDEHLGQGPYEALITVNPSSDMPADPSAVTDGEQFSIAFESM